jgi:hypothetical protein
VNPTTIVIGEFRECFHSELEIRPPFRRAIFWYLLNKWYNAAHPNISQEIVTAGDVQVNYGIGTQSCFRLTIGINSFLVTFFNTVIITSVS